MTELLFLEDSYLKECSAKVVAVEGNKVQLDRTVFYPTGGGVPCDTGVLVNGSSEFRVLEVKKENGAVWHYLDRELTEGGEVTARIDWQQRNALMRMHTAAHVLGSVMYSKGVPMTGNQIGVEETRMDFNCPTGMEREMVENGASEANDALAKDVELKVYSLPREDALKIPGMVKLADKLPPAVTSLRIVEIPGIDTQADGGCHVKNLREVGRINIGKI
ncbi:alanyl-tRNA editing protein, partial [Candidatus Micrarchaeota archaeon]|nr:alanyl-tRNA editing protein [Candidatus Micrarchaeota archaeon]